ncbi:hypothetical protein ACR77J_08190 [Tissierella praeacuta]|uniref:hypothetical protein n=1 Tax=Tissierella praeacuta TaxID=43131 RepID=UPI003DA227AA
MLIGFNAYGEDDNLAFDNRLCHTSYNRLEIKGGIIDQIYIDEDITIPYSTEKPDGWLYSTVLNARFKNSLEGGSIEAGNTQIERIKFQKRKWDELDWQDIGELEYNPKHQLLYEVIDKYVANDFVYQYSIVPIASTIIGNRITSEEVKVEFDSVFISDKDSNYQLLYDIELSDIQYNNPSAIFEPRNTQFPIVVYSNLDYATFDITATFISTETTKTGGNNVDIRMERLGKDKLLKFMKNGKPKVYRDIHGNLKLVTVVGSPKEIPYNNIGGISKLSFSLVEIGNMDSETLKSNNMLQGLSEVF